MSKLDVHYLQYDISVRTLLNLNAIINAKVEFLKMISMRKNI